MNEGGGRGVGVDALLFELGEKVAVLVPSGMHELNETGAPLQKSAGGQAVVGEGSALCDVRSVALENMFGFRLEVDQIRHAGLHPEGHFVLADFGCNLRVKQRSVSDPV